MIVANIPSANYSLEEKVVGTWIDGKPLYQKTIKLENQTMTYRTDGYGISVRFSDFGLSIDKTIKAEGICYDTLNTAWYFLHHIPTTINYRININCTNKGFDIVSPTNYNSRLSEIYVTLQYTKATD